MSKEIAVIGCGIFGAMIAIKLKQKGHKVSIYERLSEPLLGASYNNQNRLHLGFHYPRDLNTAQQCIKGFNDFVSLFPESLNVLQKNAYFIASENSKVTAEEYLYFCENLGVKFSELDLNNFPVKIENITIGVECSEYIYDASILRDLIKDKLKELEIITYFNTEVDFASFENEKISIIDKSSIKRNYERVINCSYANINSMTKKLFPSFVSNYQYEYTAVAIVEVDLGNIGVTIMDGEYMTLLPFGKSGKFLLYHVQHSVISKKVCEQLPSEWLDKETSPFSKIDKDEFFMRLSSDCQFFLPCLKTAKLCGFLEGPRMVLANKDNTDERPSLIKKYSDQYMTVFSGKIDHCIWVANDISNEV